MSLIVANVQLSKNNQYLKQPSQDTLRSQVPSTLKRASATRKHPSQPRTHSVKVKRPHHAPPPIRSASQEHLPLLNALKSVFKQDQDRASQPLSPSQLPLTALHYSIADLLVRSEDLPLPKRDEHNIYFHNT